MRALFAIIAFTAGALAQTPVRRHVTVTVVDKQGNPIRGARVDHATGIVVIGGPIPSAAIETDGRGRAAADVKRRAIVIRKPGYISSRLLVDRDGPLRITLMPLPPPLKCEPAQIPGVKTREVNGGDYFETWTYLETPDGPKGFARGRGPSYNSGAPLEHFVQDSVEYREVMDPSGMVDARGKLPDGTYWRERITFGNETHYWGVDETTARLLDRLIDGDCHP